MFTLITKISQWLLKTVIKTIEQKQLILSAVSTRSLRHYCLYDIVSGIYKRKYYTCEMIPQNIRTYGIQYIPNTYIMHKVACGILKDLLI